MIVTVTWQLPGWTDDYSSRITEEAFNKRIEEVQQLFQRANDIFAGYQKTKDEILFEAAVDEMRKAHKKYNLLRVAMQDEDTTVAEYLFELAGAIG